MKHKVVDINSFDNDRFERSRRLGWFNLNIVKEMNVLVVGAGAIGNETVKNLVLSGFHKISLVDMDFVVKSNLNRCVFFSDEDAERNRMKAEVIKKKIKRLNPSVKVNSYISRIEHLSDDFIPSFDVVLGCLDNISTRLHLNARCFHHQIPYIDGGTRGLIGKVQVVIPPKTSCLECGMNKTHEKVRNKRLSCTGKDVTFFEPKLAADINTTSIISAVQTQETLKIVHKRYNSVIRNMFYYDGNRNIAEVLEVPINPNCPHHI
jgi:molybdopterin/thiamine biosynthesis adenylyltransferase